MYYLDLRFLVPALINLILFLLQDHYHNPISNPNLWFIFISIVTLLFLLISVKLPLHVSVTIEPVRIQPGDFSGPLAVALIASVFFPKSLLWVGYGTIMCITPWHGLVLDSIVKIIWWIWEIIQAIPVLIISCIVVHQHQQEGEPKPHQVELVDVGGYQSTSELDILLDVHP
ncbi:hypothetical protein CsSME_00049960 [Camellia sinensis var. sinensis]